jgi:hypothetical protein
MDPRVRALLCMETEAMKYEQAFRVGVDGEPGDPVLAPLADAFRDIQATLTRWRRELEASHG